jgi:hypothetical protein
MHQVDHNMCEITRQLYRTISGMDWEITITYKHMVEVFLTQHWHGRSWTIEYSYSEEDPEASLFTLTRLDLDRSRYWYREYTIAEDLSMDEVCQLLCVHLYERLRRRII